MHDMQIVPFHIISFDELEDKVYAFEQLFLDVLNAHTPIKQTMIHGNQEKEKLPELGKFATGNV